MLEYSSIICLYFKLLFGFNVADLIYINGFNLAYK
jgi:hypothetical protein